MTVHWAIRSSLLGISLVAVDEGGVVALLPGDDEASLADDLRQRLPDEQIEPAGRAAWPLIDAAIAALDGAPEPPLRPRGTTYQQTVWRALRATRRGETLSYGALAQVLGTPLAARAVASACAANPIAVLIPCHRVLRADGGLGGFRWGLARKRMLLERERASP